ncbi:type II toxin-antitoxin system MqsA family antitoxin [Massilia alkalitolerans]|uniref:type II toxin-antitoxin system MqsA family antitoxin n=1 Tax=Massilia alkalitolerans TaxID=286638 RepID=UPI000A068220|nr:type II toxin-antitoxin system MqsA family antitoxin [Massilia alkalitolerans]
MKNNICPVCEEGHLTLEVKKLQQEFGTSIVEVMHRSHWCDACGLDIATTEDLKLNARAMRAAERFAQGKLTGAEIAAIRKQLRITQEAAGKLFGGGPVAFCKYENDETPPSDAMENLLWASRELPGVAAKLALRHGVKIDPVVTEKDEVQSNICVEFIPAGAANGREIAVAISAAKEATKRSWASYGTWAMNGMKASNQEFLTMPEYA